MYCLSLTKGFVMKLGQFLLTLSAVVLCACSSSETKTDQTQPAVETKAEAKNESKAAEKVEPTMSTEQMKVEIKKNEQTSPAVAEMAPPTTVPAVTHSAHEHKELPKLTGPAPAKAYGWLKNGNTRYLKGFLRKDGQSKKDIQRLVAGQNPHTVVLSCSDSRVPPELVFDQKLGEIFVVRTAGEALDSVALGSIEYAVEHLGARLILVMGHTSCGAVKAAIATMDGSSTGSYHIDQIVKNIQPRIKSSLHESAPAANVKTQSWANAQGVAKDLTDRSMLLFQYVKEGQLEIKSALYNLDSGKVDFE